MSDIQCKNGLLCKESLQYLFECIVYVSNEKGKCPYPCEIDESCDKKVYEGWEVSFIKIWKCLFWKYCFTLQICSIWDCKMEPVPITTIKPDPEGGSTISIILSVFIPIIFIMCSVFIGVKIRWNTSKFFQCTWILPYNYIHCLEW